MREERGTSALPTGVVLPQHSRTETEWLSQPEEALGRERRLLVSLRAHWMRTPAKSTSWKTGDHSPTQKFISRSAVLPGLR
jgi:hypothetical protein